jgi:hypothetical protein
MGESGYRFSLALGDTFLSHFLFLRNVRFTEVGRMVKAGKSISIPVGA